MSIKDKILKGRRKVKVETEADNDWHGTIRSEYDRIPKPQRYESSQFKKDFRTGFAFLITTGIICFIVIPLVLFILKIGVVLILPFFILGAIILMIALLGRMLNFMKSRW